ncbi:MAG TPA: tetratricopeptide repeat protein [Luteolibacter sp.]|nr:tetratricopeptide repeat protein [Luteolibacter sp.]
MKKPFLPCPSACLAIVAATVLPLSAQSAAQQAETLYRQGLAAEKSGNPEAARKAYTAALQANPRHAHARYSLGQLKINSGSIAAKGREAKFGAVEVPEYKLDEASLSDALAALQQIVRTESKGEVTPNFIVQDPKNTLAEAKITLVLQKVPAKAVLHYVLEQTGAKARHDEHAIVITPR